MLPLDKTDPTQSNPCMDRTHVHLWFTAVVARSLFPLIGIYFKQLGMNPAETGMLMGFRPFIELIAVPFWGNVAERWRRWKTVLLFSLFCWVAFTLSLAFIQPDAHSCLIGNSSYVVLAEVTCSEPVHHGSKVFRSTVSIFSKFYLYITSHAVLST